MFQKITEQESLYTQLENKSTKEILSDINQEDQKVATAVEACISAIEACVNKLYEQMKEGGRLFYIGAGTSGRLGILDASECPPTYGVPHEWVIGIIAGGDGAIRKAVEFAEDSTTMAWEDLSSYSVNSQDMVIGIAASGTTPYVIHGLRKCRQMGIPTACITCNPSAPVTEEADFPIVAIVGPEYVTGSTRMKSGTAQKLILNMITTSVMIKLGRVKNNRMVNMQLSNQKLIQRGIDMVAHMGKVSNEEATELIHKHGSVKAALDILQTK